MTTASTTGAEGARYRIDRPTVSVIMRDLRIPRHDRDPGTRFPTSTCPRSREAGSAATASPRTAAPSCSSAAEKQWAKDNKSSPYVAADQ